MKKKYFLKVGALLFFSILSSISYGQLSDEQTDALKLYMESSPEIAKYDSRVKDLVMKDPAIIKNVQDCSDDAKKYIVLEKLAQQKNLSELYAQIGQLMPEYRNRFIPVFDRKQYELTKFSAEGYGQINPAKFSSLITLYNSARIKDKLDPENSFGSMLIIYAEQIEELRKTASNTFKIPVNDKYLTAWLEMNYYEKIKLTAIKQMRIEQGHYKKRLEQCLLFLPRKLEEASKDQGAPDWQGMYTDGTYSLRLFSQSGIISGGYDKQVGANRDDMHWSLTDVNGNTAKGTWKLVAEDYEKAVVFTGPITVTLTVEGLEYTSIIDVEPTVTWKQGHSPYDVGKRAGTKLFGKFTRLK